MVTHYIWLGARKKQQTLLKNAILRNAKVAYIHARLAAVYVDLDQMTKAKSAVDEALRLKPKFSANSVVKRFKSQIAARNKWLIELLVRAGLPE